MKKRFNWKQLIGKRIASLLMIFVMFMGVVPASLIQAVAAVKRALLNIGDAVWDSHSD